MQLNPIEIGDTIALVAPASWSDRVEETRLALIDRGFQVRLASNLELRHGNFAGNDQERAEAFMEMWKDPEVKALWCIRGGYGSGKILDKLDYDYIKAHPKIFIGMSDITALHVVFNQKCDLVTFLGPVAHLAFNPDKYPQSTAEGVLKQILPEGKLGVFENALECFALAPGKGEGFLVGGNLALIAAHIGTPYQLQPDGKILLLEDVNEPPYRIDRMLNQLKQAGMLDGLQGVVLASWSGCKNNEDDEISFDIEKVLRDHFSSAPYPVILGFPSGHIDTQVTLPLNCKYVIDGDKREITLLERGVASVIAPNQSAVEVCTSFDE